MSRINVGYAYTLYGEVGFESKDYETFCLKNRIEAYEQVDINCESLKKYLIEKIDLVEPATEDKLLLIEHTDPLPEGFLF